MVIIADLGVNLLEEAANFFRSIGKQNPKLTEQMVETATVYEQVGGLLRDEPEGKLDDFQHNELAANLLRDAAVFFRTLGEQNAPIKDQMYENAQIYEQLSDLIRTNPTDEIDDTNNKHKVHIRTADKRKKEKSLKNIFND